jgi:hypothetical protein
MLYTHVFQMSSSSDHEKIDEIMSDCDSDDDYFMLVDSGYPNKEGFLAPYKGQRYHVPEFQHGPPVRLKEVFNHSHSSLRNVIERCFEILKNKWHILGYLPSYPIHKQAQIIVACMTLHIILLGTMPYMMMTLRIMRMNSPEIFMVKQVSE